MVSPSWCIHVSTPKRFFESSFFMEKGGQVAPPPPLLSGGFLHVGDVAMRLLVRHFERVLGEYLTLLSVAGLLPFPRLHGPGHRLLHLLWVVHVVCLPNPVDLR